ncbi:hypothetical protein LJC46_07405 [Desulfovibrio sp. OttesenSCG-928-G15]|nr:hypothetical protein [Desulfovibrio sp. OttesenSCG-928-G15]
MKRHYVLLYFFLLALLAMTGMFLGCSSSQAFAASSPGLAGGEPGGDAIYVASNNYVVPATTYTRPNNSNNPKDGMWQQYVGRTPAFANCSPCAESPSYKSSGKRVSKKPKKAVRRTATKKKSTKSTKSTKRRSVALPPVQADLFPDAICPPGCVPEARSGRGAPRIGSLRDSVEAAPSRAVGNPVKAAPSAANVKQSPPPQITVEPVTEGKVNGTASTVSGTVSANDTSSLRVESRGPQPASTVVPSVSMVPAAVTAGSAESSVKEAPANTTP